MPAAKAADDAAPSALDRLQAQLGAPVDAEAMYDVQMATAVPWRGLNLSPGPDWQLRGDGVIELAESIDHVRAL